MSNPRSSRSTAARSIVLGLLVAAGLLTEAAAAVKPQLRLTAYAVNLSGVGRPSPQTLYITIERWSTDEERQKLVDILVEKGPDALYDAVQDVKPRAGYIRTTSSLGWDIQFARLQELPTGAKRVIFATDRPISFYELQGATRSRDYDFMLCEIRLGPDGKGEGKLAGGAKISYDKGAKKIEIENYGIEPVRLTQVTVDK
jgi:hypothetical protein